jgi:hypothetical protein
MGSTLAFSNAIFSFLLPLPALPRRAQVVSTVVRYYTYGRPPLTFSAGGKVPADYWGKSSGEQDMLFHKGTLVTGCVDKNAFGKYGLVHAVQVCGQGQLCVATACLPLHTLCLQCRGQLGLQSTCPLSDLPIHLYTPTLK